MALYDQHDPTLTDPRHLKANDQPSPRYGGGVLLPIILAAAITIVLILMFLPSSTPTRVGDSTNAGPSVQTVTPSSSPSTLSPGPSPTTESRPTQAPIQ